MTRTIKNNDRNHAGLADGTAVPEDRLPRYFAKSGHVDADPKSIKKSGGGKGNWSVRNLSLLVCANPGRGRDGEEVHDYGYNFTNARRRSNSSGQVLTDFKSKFEALDADPVFEEGIHGPTEEEIEQASTISKEDSNDTSSYGGSVIEDDGFKKM